MYNQYDENGFISACVQRRSKYGEISPDHPRQFEDDKNWVGYAYEDEKIYECSVKGSGDIVKGKLFKDLGGTNAR